MTVREPIFVDPHPFRKDLVAIAAKTADGRTRILGWVWATPEGYAFRVLDADGRLPAEDGTDACLPTALIAAREAARRVHAR